MDTSEGAYRVLDLKALRCFWATAKHGSLTRASIELGISEPAISKRLRSLEAYLATKLYESRGGRFRLTPSGQRTMEMAISLFERLEEFERALAGQEAEGSLVIAAQDPVQLYLLPDAIRRFSGDHPRVRLRVLNRRPEETIDMVRKNEADLGIMPLRQVPEGLVFRPWRTFPAYLLLPLGHPLTRRGRIAVRDLLTYENVMRYPLMVPAEDSEHQQRVGEGLRREGLPFNVAFEVGSFETVKRYVAQGLGIAVVPGSCLTQEDRERLIAVEIPAEFRGETTYGVLLRQDKHMTAALTNMLSLLDVSGSR